jgi:hypothetical protein
MAQRYADHFIAIAFKANAGQRLIVKLSHHQIQIVIRIGAMHLHRPDMLAVGEI